MFDRRHPLGWLFLLLAVAVSPGPPPGTAAVSEVQYRGVGARIGPGYESGEHRSGAKGADDGVRGSVRQAEAPTPRTSADCENATLENLFGGRSGAEKKDAAMSFVSAALQLSDAVTARHIVDEEKFKQGLSNLIDGVVLCLNSSTWSKPVQP